MARTGVLFMQSQAFMGADSVVHKLIMRELDRERFDVHAACTTERGAAADRVRSELAAVPNLRVRPTTFGPSVAHRDWREVAREAPSVPGTVLSLATLVRYVRKHSIRIIHCTEKPRDAVLGTLLARATGARAVIHLHVKCHDQLDPKVTWAMRRADALIGVSGFIGDTVVASGYHAEKVYTALNGIDVDRWNRDADGGDVRADLGIPPDALVVLIAARIFGWKGHRALLEAAARVAPHRPELRILIVGQDDPRAHPDGGRFSDELRTLSQHLDLADRTIFAGFRDDMEAVMAAADIYMMPSFEEPLGLVYLEAMAMRKPVIALRSGGVPEVVCHGQTGLLAEPGDIDGLANHLRTLADHPALRECMGRAGRERVEAHFRPERLARDVERIYDAVLARPQV